MDPNTPLNSVSDRDLVKHLSDIHLSTETDGITSNLFISMDTETIRYNETSVAKMLSNYKVFHRKLMEYAKINKLLATAVTTIRQEDNVFVITSKDVLNHATIREIKQKADDFLNTLTQVGYQVYVAGSMGTEKQNTIIASRVRSGAYIVTRVGGSSENERLMWARVIHATKMYMALGLERIEKDLTAAQLEECGYNLRDVPDFLKKSVLLESVQLEMNSGDGPASQLPDDTLQFSEVSQVAQNTEITHQVDFSKNTTYESGSLLQDITSTEPPANLAHLSERYIRIIDDNLEFSITDTANDIIFDIDVPSGLYRFLDTTISTALQNYTLINCDVEFTIKVNANQAQCGRYVVAHWPNFDQMNNSEFDNVYRMLQRDHAIIDLSVSNDIVYTVKYENLRSYVAVQANEIGELSGGNFARLTMRCLSPVRIADSGNPRCPFQVFARLVNVKLVGMRYPVPTDEPVLRRRGGILVDGEPELEMNSGFNSRFDETVKSVNSVINAIPVVGPINKLIGNIFGNGSIAIAKLFNVNMDRIKAVESRLIYMGMINKDRPVDINHPQPLLPQPVHSYSYGRGPYVSKKMRLEPEATTPHFGEHCTVETSENVLDYARIPGLCAKFEVTTTMVQGELLIELPVLPYDPRYRTQYPVVPHIPFPNFGTPPQSRGSAYQVSPVAYFSQMYNYYSGSIVYDFAAIKTTSHNFTMQVAFVPFNGTPGSTSDEQMQSCKWKTIDFRTAETSSFTVPWISPIMMRTFPIDDPVNQSTPNSTWNQLTASSIGSGMKDPGKVVVRLVNPLNPTPIVSPSIEVLVFNKAHSNLRFLSPKPNNFASTLPPTQWMLTHNVASTGLSLTRQLPTRARIPNAEMPRLEMSDGPVQSGDEQTPIEDPLSPAPGPYIQSLENHTNILDACRRFQYHTTVTGAHVTGSPNQMPFAMIPVNIFGWFTVPAVNVGPSFMTENQPLATFRDAVSGCFRYYRGSMNFTLHVLNNIPVEVVFVPPVVAANWITGGLANTLTPIAEDINQFMRPGMPYDRGFAFEVIEPRVNPLQTIEVPFYNPNIYNDCQAMLANLATWNPNIRTPGGFVRRQDKSALDLLSCIMGHIIIRQLDLDRSIPATDPRSSFKVRISSALGDDFRYYHFMGTPPVYYNPTTVWEMRGGISTRSLSREEIDAELVKSGIEENPGPFFSKSCSELKDKAFSNTAAIYNEIKNFVQSPSKISNQLEELKNCGSNIVEYIHSVLSAYSTGLDVVELLALATALVSALEKNASWYSVVTAFLLIAKVTGLFTAEAVSKVGMRLTLAYQKYLDKQQIPTTEGLNSELDGTMVGSVLAGLLIEGLTIFSSERKPQIKEEYVFQTVIRYFTGFNFMRAGAICLFFNRFASAITWLWNRASVWVVGLRDYDLLRDPHFIRSFMEDYSYVMNELNLSAIHLSSLNRHRYWSTVTAAYYLKGVLAVVKDPKLKNPALLSAVNEIIKRSNDVKSFMTAPPVRYEPFSFWFYGPPGTGKSTLSHGLCVNMAKNIGHSFEGDPVYVRSPHSKFWNGYDGQPVIHMDDANGVNDPQILGGMISEYQAMCSCARMRIEMPRLEEKNSEVTSTVICICSNLFSWKSSMIVDEQAFLRRRHVVAELRFTDAAIKWFNDKNGKYQNARDLPPEMREDNKHVMVYLHSTPVDNRVKEKYSFKDFEQLLYKKHKEYHAQEIDKMFERYKVSLSLSREAAQRIVDEATWKTAITCAILGGESPEAISATINYNLLQMQNLLPEQFEKLPGHTQYILEQMKQTPSLEANSLFITQQCYPRIENASAYIKENFFGNYDSNLWTAFSSIFFPWKNLEKRKAFVDNNITNACISCQQMYTDERSLGWICGNSTSENQHWECNRCYTSRPAAAPVTTCQTCRADAVLFISQQERQWNLYRKAAHLIYASGTLISAPFKITFNYIWENAEWLAMATTILAVSGTCGAIMIDDIMRAEMARNEALTSAEQFIKDWGVMPDTRLKTPNGYAFGIGNDLYEKQPDGHYYKTAPKLQMGKKGDKSQPSCSKQFDEKKIDGYLSCQSSGDEKQESKRFEFSLNDLPVIQCNESHRNCNALYDLIKTRYTRTAPGIVGEGDEANYSLVDNEGNEYKICVASCVDSACPLNKCMLYIISNYNRHEFTGSDEENAEKINANPHFYPIFVRSRVLFNNPQVLPSRFHRMITYQAELYKSLISGMVGWFQTIYNTVCEHWKIILTFITMLLSGYFGYKFIDDSTSQLESPHAGQKNAKVNTRTLTMAKRGVRETNLDMTSMHVSKHVPAQVETIANIVAKQKVKISAADKSGVGIIIASQLALVPRHTIYTMIESHIRGIAVTIELPSGDFITLQNSIGHHIVKDYQDRELVVISHPRFAGKDIRKHIYATDLDDVTYPHFGYVFDVDQHITVPVKIERAVNETDESVDTIQLKTTIGGQDYQYDAKFYDYLLTTGVQGQGKCGSVLFDPSGRIIGMHVAGYKRSYSAASGVGFNVVLYREEYADDVLRPSLSVPVQKPGLQMQSSLHNLRHCYNLARAPYHSEHTKIRPSAIAESAWPSITQPCIQSNKDPRYLGDTTPLIDGASTIGAPTEEPDRQVLQVALEAVIAELVPKMPPPSMPVPTSFHEAVTAQNHMKVEPMKLNTSAGLPLIVENPGKNLKSDYISHEVINEKHVVNFKNNFEKQFWKKHNARKNGAPPRDPFWAHLKDERRKIPKLMSFGGTRVFSVAPLELVVTSRMLLLPFMNSFHSDPVGLHHGIGLAPDSPMWTDFVEYHRSKGDCLIQLDFSKFSDSMPWSFVTAAFMVVKSYYMKYGIMTPDVQHSLNTIEYEITRSRVCVGSGVYELKNGTLQGHPITSLINSLVNIIEQVYIWCVVTRLPASQFFLNCSLTVMGDDVIIAVRRDLIKIYNGQLIAKAFADLKIQVTDENKDATKVRKFQPFHELSFMGRSFQLHPFRHVYLAPADMESIFDTPLWIQRKDSPHFDATEENVDQSLSLMYGHGPLVYEMYRSVLQYLCPNIPLRSWYELDFLFMENTGLKVSGDEKHIDPNDYQYYSQKFLKSTGLMQVEVATYRCVCRYNCEVELLARVQQCSYTHMRQILPFPSQEEGSEMMGARLIVRLPVRPSISSTPTYINLVAPDIRTFLADPITSGVLYSPEGETHSAVKMETDNVYTF